MLSAGSIPLSHMAETTSSISLTSYTIPNPSIMSLATRASKRTLYGSIAFALFSVWGVHYAQKIESEVCPCTAFCVYFT